MTKNRIYNILTAEGVELPPLKELSKAELEAKYAELHPEYVVQKPDVLETQDEETAQAEAEPEQPEKELEPGPIPSLHFQSAGWCEQLGRSYYVGWYQPTSWDEYNALKPFAEG